MLPSEEVLREIHHLRSCSLSAVQETPPAMQQTLPAMQRISAMQRVHLQCRRPRFDSWVGKILWRRDRLPTPLFLGFPCGSAGKESACNAGDVGSVPGLRRSPGEGKGPALQHSGLENSMDCIVHGVAELDMTERL